MKSIFVDLIEKRIEELKLELGKTAPQKINKIRSIQAAIGHNRKLLEAAKVYEKSKNLPSYQKYLC